MVLRIIIPDPHAMHVGILLSCGFVLLYPHAKHRVYCDPCGSYYYYYTRMRSIGYIVILVVHIIIMNLLQTLHIDTASAKTIAAPEPILGT